MDHKTFGDLSVEVVRHHIDYDALTGIFRWRVPTNSLVVAGEEVSVHVTHKRYKMISLQGRTLLAHRLAWFHVHGSLPRLPSYIVARNGDYTDLRLENLTIFSKPAQDAAISAERRLQARQQSLWDRIKKEHDVCGWKSFASFKKDVSDPKPYHRIVAIDTARPVGPKNWALKPLAGFDRKTENGRRDYYLNKNRIRKPQIREHHLQRKFDISLEEYAAMSKAQGDVCAICKQPETATRLGTKLPLAVDHCHGSGEIRELLCRDCNHVLGKFKDDPSRFRAAADYLDRHRAKVDSVPASSPVPLEKER